MSDRIRQAFEAADQDLFSLDPSLYTRGTDGRYDDMPVQCRWETWLSSRRVALEEAAAICEAEHLECPTRSDGDIAYDNAVRDCASAIRREAEGK